MSAKRIVVARPHRPGPVTVSDVTVTRKGATTSAPMAPTTKAGRVMLAQRSQPAKECLKELGSSPSSMARVKAVIWLRMSVSVKTRQRDDSKECVGEAGSGHGFI